MLEQPTNRAVDPRYQRARQSLNLENPALLRRLTRKKNAVKVRTPVNGPNKADPNDARRQGKPPEINLLRPPALQRQQKGADPHPQMR